MDSQVYDYLQENFGFVKSLILEPLNKTDLDSISFAVGLTRDFREINRHFGIFLFELNELFYHYDFRYDGYATDHISGRPADEESDYIAIDALVRIIISSGRILVDAMQSFIKPDKEESQRSAKSKKQRKSSDSDIVNAIDKPITYIEGQSKEIKSSNRAFLGFMHSTYDRNWTYQLWYELRNYTQHLHLPINRRGAAYFIDYDVIVNRPHYNMKSNVKSTIKKYIQMLQQDSIRYRIKTGASLVYDLIEYSRCIILVCIKFYECMKPIVQCAIDLKKAVIGKHTWRIACGSFFIYKYEAGSQNDSSLDSEYYLDTDENGEIIVAFRGKMRGTDLELNTMYDLDTNYDIAKEYYEKYERVMDEMKKHIILVKSSKSVSTEKPDMGDIQS